MPTSTLSIPKAFGTKEKATANELGIFPIKTKTGIGTMSVRQSAGERYGSGGVEGAWSLQVLSSSSWTDVLWGDVDYMFVDMPPGTGDVPLTVFQSLPVDGIIVVTSPQELVSMIVGKAVKMAEMMNIPRSRDLWRTCHISNVLTAAKKYTLYSERADWKRSQLNTA